VPHTPPWEPGLLSSLTGVGPGPSARARRAALRAALAAATASRPGAAIEPLVLPGATDALGARLVEEAGFAAVYATGAGLANAGYGLPDIGLISQAEVVDHAGRLAEATRVPLIDTHSVPGPVGVWHAHQYPLSSMRCAGSPLPRRRGPSVPARSTGRRASQMCSSPPVMPFRLG